MSRYALTLYRDEYTTWLRICKKMHGPILNIGDKVRLSDDFKDTRFADYLPNKQYTVDYVNKSKWEHFPCQQYIGLKGVNHLFLNTVLSK